MPSNSRYPIDYTPKVPVTPTLKEHYDNLVEHLSLINKLDELNLKHDCFPDDLSEEDINVHSELSGLISELKRCCRFKVKPSMKKIERLIKLEPFK